MGCIISCLACQAVSCCAGAVCKCGKTAIPCTKSVGTRIMYAFLFFLVASIGYVLDSWGYKILSFVPQLDLCHSDDKWCIGALASLRVFFALSVFHLIFSVFMIRVQNSKDFRAGIQDGWWLVKFAAVAGIAVAAFFIPNIFFVAWSWISLFGAAIFILIQLVLLIDFAYFWAESWLGYYDDSSSSDSESCCSSKFWVAAIYIATILMYAGSFALSGVEFGLFYKGKECWMNIVFPIINIIMTIFYSFLSIHPHIQHCHQQSNRHGSGPGLLHSAVVSLYSSYLVFSSATSEPTTDDFQCNPFDNVSSSITSLLLGAGFTIVAVCYSTIQASTQGNNFVSGRGGSGISSSKSVNTEKIPIKSSINSKSGDAEDEEDGHKHHSDSDVEDSTAPIEDDEVQEVTYDYSFFHLTFMLGAMYVCMVIIDWQLLQKDSSSSSESTQFKIDYGFASVWVKVATSWLVGLLYIWTLFAPVIFPNRTF